MRLHLPPGYEQPFRDLRIRKALSGKLSDPRFSWREAPPSGDWAAPLAAPSGGIFGSLSGRLPVMGGARTPRPTPKLSASLSGSGA